MGDVADSMRARERRTIRPDHLPECDVDTTVNYRVDCICDRLRQAEQRVLDEERTKEKWFCSEEDKQALIAHGVQAARDAVDGTLDVPHRSVQYVDAIVDAVAAIDALTTRGKEGR